MMMVAVTVGRRMESAMSWPLKKMVQALSGYREMEISVGEHEVVTAMPSPPELVEVMRNIQRRATEKRY